MSIFDSKAFQNGQLSGLDAAQRLGEETIDSGERLVRLQFQALRLASDGFFAGWRRLLSVRGPEAAAELSPAAQAERLLEYGRQVQELAAAGQKVFSIWPGSRWIAVPGSCTAWSRKWRRMLRRMPSRW
ncbi:TIGR01841 family phasin [Azotobacter chroococcum]